jgi:hypothetical protein
VEAVDSMLIPGSDEEKEYLKYLLNKHKDKKKDDEKSFSSSESAGR